MAWQLTLSFDGLTAEDYEAVNAALGLDMATGAGEWPEGLLRHAAGTSETGSLVVTEVWRSKADQERFMSGRLGEAMAKAGVSEPPTSVTWVELISEQDLKH